MKPGRVSMVVVAASLAAVVAFVALGHTHTHASSQSPPGPATACVFCAHTASAAPPVTAALSPPAGAHERPCGVRPEPWPRTFTAEHPGRGPPFERV